MGREKVDKTSRFYRSGWRDRNAVKESDKEWIARGGHLGTEKAWATIDRGAKQSLHDWLNPHDYHMPEHALWEAFWMLQVQDALGKTPASKRHCTECHLDHDCKCYSNPDKAGRISYANRLSCTWVPHTGQQCAINYINSDMAKEDAALMGIEIDFFRKLLTGETGRAKRKLTSFKRSAIA